MTNEKTQLDKLLDYAESAMADGYPYEVIDGDLALTVKALRAFKASQNEPEASHCAYCKKPMPDPYRHWSECEALKPPRHADTCPSLRSIGPEPCNCEPECSHPVSAGPNSNEMRCTTCGALFIPGSPPNRKGDV